jgi:RNA methyltransferase, TrmH family
MLTKAALQRLRSLRDKKNREALGLFVIEGDKVVSELLASNFPLVEVYATGDWRDSPSGSGVPPLSVAGLASAESRKSDRAAVSARTVRAPRLRPTRITADEMARISQYPTPSAVLAVGKIVRRALVPGTLDRGLTLALDAVQDAGNVGTLLRIADWFGFDRVLLSPDCADVFHPKVINASMGSFARVPVFTVELGAALDEIASKVAVLGCDLAGDDVHSLPAVSDAIVIIGNEGHGLSPAVAARVTRKITIPRHGNAESLNAAVAAAIVCDNLKRISGPRLPGKGS